MSAPTDLERRIASALHEAAEQVQPHHLSPGSVPVVPLRRRTSVVLLAIAASVLLAVALVTLNLDQGERRMAPAPRPEVPEVVPPVDVGRDWDRAKASPPAELDLDGDGTDEKVRFLAEPSEDYSGRVRLETTLTGDGTDVFGLVDLGSTLGVGQQDPIDADQDGDQEMVLYRPDPENEMNSLPLVLDLSGGMLVEAPPSDTQLLRNGTAKAEGGTEHYEMVRLSDYWIEEGTLHSVQSVRSFASLGMTLFRPREYEADALVWHLGEDGVLRPEPGPEPCLRITLTERRPCAPGETDSLPTLAPLAEHIEMGDSFTSTRVHRFSASLQPPTEPDADADLVLTQGTLPEIRTTLRTGARPLLFTAQPTGVSPHSISVLVASGDGDEPVAHQLLAQDRDRMVPVEPVGDVPLGTGFTGEDGRAFRTWLTREGSLLTAVAQTPDENGPWTVSSWVMVDRQSMVAAPLDTVCFDDATDPGTARRC